METIRTKLFSSTSMKFQFIGLRLPVFNSIIFYAHIIWSIFLGYIVFIL